MQRIQYRLFAPLLRSVGKRMVESANFLAGDTIANVHLQPNPNKTAVGQKSPALGNFLFVAPNSVVAGDVRTDEGSQVYFNSTLKASGNGKIELGERVIVMDHVIIKADDGHKVSIGNASLISPHAYLHNCTLGKGAFVGPKATVSVGCEIAEYGGLAAGSTLAPGDRVPTHQFYAGNPAKFLREMTTEEIEFFKDLQENYDKLGEIYLKSNQMDGAELATHLNRVKETNNFDENTGYVADEMELVTAKEFGMAVTKEDYDRRYTREMDRFREMPDISEIPEMLYDGNHAKNPGYLNELNKDYKLENDLKRKLEYDPEARRMKKEEFDQKRISVSDKEFKRKF